jgi:hypothetical protein
MASTMTSSFIVGGEDALRRKQQEDQQRAIDLANQLAARNQMMRNQDADMSASRQQSAQARAAETDAWNATRNQQYRQINDTVAWQARDQNETTRSSLEVDRRAKALAAGLQAVRRARRLR